MRYLVLGSLNIDMTYRVEHIVNAGETISSVSVSRSAGGKGANQAASLAKAGEDVYFVGKVGSDGSWVLDKLSSYGVNISKTIVSDTEETGTAIIQVDSRGQNSIILHAGGNKAFAFSDIEGALKDFSLADVLVLENEINLLPEIIDMAYDKNLVIAFNPSPCSSEILSLPLSKISYFFLNEIEAETLSCLGRPLKEDCDFRTALKLLKEKYPQSTIVVTAGKKGAYLIDDSGICFAPIVDIPVKDTTGAGDTFLGYCLSSLMKGEGGQRALERASVASAIAVSRSGAMEAIPTKSEVDNFS